MKRLKYLTLIAFTCASFFVQAHEKSHKEIINQDEKNITIPKVSVQLWSVKNEIKQDI